MPFNVSRHSRFWLQADLQPPEFDVRFTPNSGHWGFNARFFLNSSAMHSEAKHSCCASIRKIPSIIGGA